MFKGLITDPSTTSINDDSFPYIPLLTQSTTPTVRSFATQVQTRTTYTLQTPRTFTSVGDDHSISPNV